MRILVPVDNSNQALKALDKAIEIAKVREAKLTIMSVEPQVPDPTGELPAAFADALHNDAVRAVKTAKEVAEKAGVTCQGLIEMGASPAENILRYAEESKTDLIVMGHRGMSGVTRFLVGSVAGSVVTHAPCSVLVVR